MMSLTKVSYSMISGAVANVLDYGASPSASATINTAAINAAIAANEVVYFPAGTYNINDSIAPGEKNCTLIGEAPNTVIFSSSNAAADVILFYRRVGQNGYITQVININTVGGLNGIHIYGGACGTRGLIENVYITSAANAGLLIDTDPTDFIAGSTFIYGKVRNVRIELGTIGTGIKVVGYNMINATMWDNISVSGCSTGLSISETVATGQSVQFNNLAIEATQQEAIQITGTEVLINNLYTEKTGFVIDTADINLNSATDASYRAVLTLINPYFGPRWGDSVAQTTRVSFRTNFCTLTCLGLPPVGTVVFDGNSKTSGAFIYLLGSGVYASVINFSNNEYRSPADWSDVVYSAGNFTASGSMTWTVTSGQQLTYSYILSGHVMTISFAISPSTLGGTPSNYLYIAIPAGKTAIKKTANAIAIYNNSTSQLGTVFAVAGQSKLYITKADGSNFTLDSTTDITGQITINI